MAKRNACEMQTQREIEAVRWIKERANGFWDAMKWHEINDMKGSVHEWMSEWKNSEPTNEPINESMSEPKDEPLNESMTETMKGSTNP